MNSEKGLFTYKEEKIFNKNNENKLLGIKIIILLILFFNVCGIWLIFNLKNNLIYLIKYSTKKLKIINHMIYNDRINKKNFYKKLQNKKIEKYIDKIKNINKPKINILEPYIKQQNEFCENPSKFYNKLIEEQIRLQNIKLNGISYKMYIYKKINFMTSGFRLNNSYEKTETINILKALEYYGVRNNITNNKNIFMLDIGGNIGWYPSFLGRFGYSILSFEPLERNIYIMKKNYCLINKNSNVVIITKGINNEEKECDYYNQPNNIGNGMIICDEKEIKNELLKKIFKKSSKVSLTKLSTFFQYLSDKNIALIKIDVEGAEGKVIESGIEIITKYHIPFIFIEFSPIYLKFLCLS